MKLPADLAPLAEPLESAIQFLKFCGHPGMVIGGVAVALRSRTRQTADVDLAIWFPDVEKARELLQAARDQHLEPRIADAAEFAVDSHMLLLRHATTGVAVDIALSQIEFEHEAIERRSNVRAGRFWIPTATAEDLIVMKAVAHRPQDLLDIRSLAQAAPRLDRRRILRWVGQFAELMERFELVDEIRQMLDESRPRRRGRSD